MPDMIQIITTTATRAEALRLARALVEQRLAACVQIDGPLTSVYRWQGAIEEAEEWRCLIKTGAALYPQVEAAIRALHSYATPEILAVPVVAGNADYLAWLEAALQPDEG